MKQILLIGAALLAALVIGGASIYEYDHRAVAPAGETVAQAVQGQVNEEQQLSLIKAVDTVNLNNANSQIQKLTQEKTNVCASLESLKASNPNCN